jgi:hypothetical protein
MIAATGSHREEMGVFGGRKKKAMSLMESGTRAVGTITDVRDTGQTLNDDPRVKMTFRLKKLEELPASGALTDEEFAAQKAKVLSQI